VSLSTSLSLPNDRAGVRYLSADHLRFRLPVHMDVEGRRPAVQGRAKTIDSEKKPSCCVRLIIALRSAHDDLLAVMLVEEIFARDADAEAAQVLCTTSIAHPLVAEQEPSLRRLTGSRSPV
jgi:hypothetical protein